MPTLYGTMTLPVFSVNIVIFFIAFCSFVVLILETTVQYSICSDGWLLDRESGREYPEAA